MSTTIYHTGPTPALKPITLDDPRIPDAVRAVALGLLASGPKAVDVFERHGNARQPVSACVVCWTPWDSDAARALRALGAHDSYMDQFYAMSDPREQSVSWYEPLPRLPAAFLLRRKVDVAGISGTGDVAEGCAFADGTAVVHWRGEHATTTVHPSLDTVRAVHCHAGATEIVWLDGAP